MAAKTQYGPGDSDESLKKYLKEISKIKILTPEEEKKLAIRVAKGDEESLRKLVEANLRFVVSFSKKYQHCGLSLLDLINEGNIGLIEAAKRYDYKKGVRFLTYAVWWIRQAIVQALTNQGGDFRLSQRDANLMYRLGRTITSLTNTLKRNPSVDEIAGKMEISKKKVNELMLLSTESVSLDNFISEENLYKVSDTVEQESVPAADTTLLKRALSNQLASCIQELSIKEREVIKHRYGLDGHGKQTLKEIGKKLSLSRERVRQIELKALEKLRISSKVQQLRGYLN